MKIKSIPASESPSLTDLAWAAGFIEGEGCFSRSGRRKGKNLERVYEKGTLEQVSVAQVNAEPLYRLQKFFGGCVSWRHPKTSSIIGHVPRPIQVWSAYGPRARGIMQTIYVFMSERRKEQIRKALLVGHDVPVINHAKSAEHRAKISATLKGRSLTEETKAKLSLVNKGKRLSSTVIAIRRAKQFKHSDETKRKMSLSAKRWRAERRSKTVPRVRLNLLSQES